MGDPSTDQNRCSDFVVARLADGVDTDRVGRAGRARRHAGDDDDGVPGLSQMLVLKDLIDLGHHLVGVLDLGHLVALHAPGDGELVARLVQRGEGQHRTG